MKKIKVITSVITICIMALIFFFSSQNSDESSHLSSGITLKVAEMIVSVTKTDRMTAGELELVLHHFIRKCAHFSEYALLGIFVSANLPLHLKRPRSKIWLYTVVFCMLYAVSDEIHQYFVPGRTARIFDVLVDTSGAAVGAAIWLSNRKLYNFLFTQKHS